MLTVSKSHKMGLLNHDRGYKGQAQIRNSELLDKFKPVALEANIGDIIILTKHTPHCSLPNKSNKFRISMDLRYNKGGQPSGREALPSFYVKSKNKKNIKIYNYKQWLGTWEKAKQKCIARGYTFKYNIPTFKNTKRDLKNII